MSKQSFTTGQVLTAAQVNSLQANDYNQTVSVKTASYVLAAADKGTRIEFNTSGSVTCTVNSGLFDAGDTLVIQNRGAGAATVTAGTATVNTSSSLVVKQYDSGVLYFVSDSSAIYFASDAADTPLTTKGDLFTFSTAADRIGVGANGTVLTAASGETTGLKWASATAPANFTLLNTGGTALTAATTVTVSGISGADKILIVVVSASSANASAEFYVRLNTDTGANYLYGGGAVVGYSTYSAIVVDKDQNTAATKIPMANMSTNAGSTVSGYLLLSGCNTAGVKVFNGAGGANASTGNTNANYSVGGVYTGSSTISSISMFSSSGNFDAGTVYVYTSA